MGLRLGEGLRLQVGDIDSINQRVHIRNATKSRLHEERGNKDRLVPLPANTLYTLKRFWSVHKHPVFIFQTVS